MTYMYVYECTCFIPQSVVHGLLGFVQQHLLVLTGHIPFLVWLDVLFPHFLFLLLPLSILFPVLFLHLFLYWLVPLLDCFPILFPVLFFLLFLCLFVRHLTLYFELDIYVHYLKVHILIFHICLSALPCNTRAIARTLIGGGGVYSYIHVLPH